MSTRYQEQNRAANGRYQTGAPCHCCGKSVKEDGDYATDEDVCGMGADGPGFMICDRKRCGDRIRKLGTVELDDWTDPVKIAARRELYTRQCAENDAAQREGRAPKTVPLNTPGAKQAAQRLQ